VNVGS